MSRRAGKKSIARRRAVGLAGLVLLVLAAGPTVIAQDAPAELDPARPGGRVIVKLRPALAERVETALPLDALRLKGATADPDVESFLVRHGIGGLSPVHPGRLHAKKQGRPAEPDLSTTYVLETSARTTAALEQTLEGLRQDPDVEFAEPDEVARISVAPTDPYDVRAGAVVAVVDTGVDHADPDIADRAWSNPNEVAGNALDDDENGYVDDVHGWDFVGAYHGTPTPDADPADVYGHGTRVARIVAAGAQVMAVKGLDDHGSGFDSSLAAAIVYAADNGAGVILNGWRGRGHSQAVAEAIQYASSLGVVVAGTGDGESGPGHEDSPETSPLAPVSSSAAAVTAVFDPQLRAPRCFDIGLSCDSGTLLDGRGPLGPEPNAPNTIGNSCADGKAGIYHVYESNDRIRVSTQDGTAMAPGKVVKIEATVWAYQSYFLDHLDLYYSANGISPEWTLIATRTPTNAGFGVISVFYTLPQGAVQAVRARFREGGSAAPCGPEVLTDHDDLVFQVTPSNYAPVANPGGPYSGAVGAPIQFSGLGSTDADGDPLSYDWIFGDGFSASGPMPTHTYASTGTYTASLTVSDPTTSSAPAQVSVSVIVSGDIVPPTASLSDPLPGSRLRGLVVASAEAADNVAVTRVEFYVDGVRISTDTAAPYRALWDTRLGADGPHTIWARAFDAGTNSVESVRIPVIVVNGKASYDAGRRAPRCPEPGPICDSGTLVNGRGPLGPEPNHPNTMDITCLDGTGGAYHVNESNDRIRVSTLDGTPMAPGKVVRVEATVWADAGFSSDRLQLYHTATADAPAWTPLATLTPAFAGAQVLSTTFTLPAGPLQAVRARFGLYSSVVPGCITNEFYTDRDDLIFPVPANGRPVANPGGPYSGKARQAITLSGAGSSDPEGDVLTYAWDFGDGDAGTGPNPTHAYLSPGTYTVTLTVNDGVADSLPATTTLTVIDQSPVANPGGPYSARRGTLITFNGSGTDADGDALSYRWDFGDGQNGSGAAPTHAYASRGTFPVTLTANDGYVDSAPATTTATITNNPPVGSAGGPYAGARGTSISFAATGTDADGDDLTYRWSFGDGATVVGANVTHTYLGLGTFTVTLVASDGQDDSVPATTTVTIANRAPVANPGVGYQGARGAPIEFNGSGTDADGDPLTYRWSFGDGGTGVGNPLTHAYASLGIFTVTLTVNDGYVDSAPATTTATITNNPPVANPGGPYAGVRGTLISFAALGTDADGDDLTYRWSFGDGTTTTGANVTHAYLGLGTFTVTLVASDGQDDSAPATTTVAIANRAPVANPGVGYQGVRGAPIKFNGSGTDADGDPLTYRWSFGDASTGIGNPITHAYASLGIFTVTLVVNDGLVDSAPATTTADIFNRPPDANPGGPYTGVKGVPITFNGSGSDADGDALTYRWEFGDGTTGAGPTVTHAYALVTTFTARLIVNDGRADSGGGTSTVTIVNRPPVADAGGPYVGARGEPTIFSGSGTDADGDSLTYNWNFGDGTTGTGPSPSHVYASVGTFTATLTVNDGLTDSAPATTTVAVTNRPVAIPGGPYTGAKGVPITFNGSGTDIDGDSLTYKWNFGDGHTGTGRNAAHAYDTRGTFNVTLAVNDGRIDSLPVATTVAVVNRAPVANPGGPYMGVRGAPISFSGSGTDPDGDALNYWWMFGDGTSAPGPGATAAHAYAGVGTFTATLVVTDGQGATASATTTVTIANRPPTANPGGPYTGVRGMPITLSGSGTDADGDALTYGWDFGDGSTGTGTSATHAYATAGTFTVTLTVSDGLGGSVSATTTATISNRAPTANPGGPYTGVRGVPITLSGSGTDADGDALTYSWSFGDGSTGTGATPSHAYANLGTFIVTLTVSDGFGGSASATTTATISNRPPTANPGGPYSGVRGVPITLNGSATDADGDALTYRWTFGDGATGTGASATHAYVSLGTFTVTLIANDGRVDSPSATTMVTIINLPPVANAGADGRAGRNSLVILSGSASDPDGSIVTYRWRQVSGPGVVLSGANTSQARFMTPSVFGTTPLAFELTVTDNDGATATDEIVITVCGNPKACFDE